MKHKIVIAACITAIVLMFSGCSSKPISIKDYLSYLNDPENGLVKTQYVAGVKISVKYLPTDYLVFLETRRTQTDLSDLQIDSLRKVYKNQRVFMLVLGTDDREGKATQDVMTSNIESYEEYKQRVYEMSFYMQDYIELITDKGTYKPVLSHYENTQDVSQERKIQLVFAPTKSIDEFDKLNYYDLKLTDELFSTGITHFRIEQKDISNIPTLLF